MNKLSSSSLSQASLGQGGLQRKAHLVQAHTEAMFLGLVVCLVRFYLVAMTRRLRLGCTTLNTVRLQPQGSREHAEALLVLPVSVVEHSRLTQILGSLGSRFTPSLYAR